MIGSDIQTIESIQQGGHIASMHNIIGSYNVRF